MDTDTYRDVHPEDAARTADLAYDFVANGKEHKAVCRNKTSKQENCHIIHADGKRIHMQEQG